MRAAVTDIELLVPIETPVVLRIAYFTDTETTVEVAAGLTQTRFQAQPGPNEVWVPVPEGGQRARVRAAVDDRRHHRVRRGPRGRPAVPARGLTMRDRVADAALSAVIGLVVLGPFLLHRGFALRGDMVFVPHQPWKDAWLGLDGSTARFVPGDAVVSVLTSVVPGDLVQKALLLGAFVLGGTGAGLLVRHHGFVARAAAIVLMCWNPWVAERLLIGQWGLVVGYAALPWVVLAAATVRDDVRRGLPALVCALGFSALWSPPAALLASLAALCVVVVRPRLDARSPLSPRVSVLVSLPWLVPSLFASDRVTAHRRPVRRVRRPR